MKLISWNVNGIRACITKGFEDRFHELDADIFCLQETKCQQGQVKLDLPGYYQYWNYANRRGYSGTAVFAKKEPLSVTNGIGVEEHDKEVVQEDDEEGQAADGEDGLDGLPVQSLPADGQGRFPSEEDGEDVGQNAHLRQHGGQSGTLNAHPQTEDEQRIQHRVHHRPQQDGQHPLPCQPLCQEELVHAHAGEGSYGAQDVGLEVGGGVGVDGVAAAQEVEQGALDGQEEDGQRERGAQEEQEAVVDGVLGGGSVPAPHGDAEDGGAADADEGGEGGDCGEGGGADAHGGQGEGTVGSDVAHEDAVYHAVQNIEKLRQHGGQAQAQDQLWDGDGVKFSFHRHTSFKKSPL